MIPRIRCEVCHRPPTDGAALKRLVASDGARTWYCEECAPPNAPNAPRSVTATAIDAIVEFERVVEGEYAELHAALDGAPAKVNPHTGDIFVDLDVTGTAIEKHHDEIRRALAELRKALAPQKLEPKPPKRRPSPTVNLEGQGDMMAPKDETAP